jgi:hypothetical protein
MTDDRMRITFVNPSLRPESVRRQLTVGLACVMTAKDLERRLTEARYEHDRRAAACVGVRLAAVRGRRDRLHGGRRLVANERRPLVADIDTLGFPDWSLFDLDHYREYARVNANMFSERVLSFPLNAARDEVAYLERIGDRQDFHINLTKMADEELVETVETELRRLADDLGIELESVFKTGTYRRPADAEGPDAG